MRVGTYCTGMNATLPPPASPTEPLRLTREDAVAFFSALFRGEHHIPNGSRRGDDGVTPHGLGWCVIDDGTNWATFDFNELTRLVFLAHDRCLRVEVTPARNGKLKIAIWRREREGAQSRRHPTLEKAVEAWRATEGRQDPADAIGGA